MSETAQETPKKPARSGWSWRRLIRRSLFWLLVVPGLLLFLLIALLYLPPVQDLVRGKVVAFLSEKTGTPVALARIRLVFPLDLKLEGLHVADDRGDTLLYAGTFQASVGWRALMGSRLRLNRVSLSDARCTLRQYPDSSFNFDFIVEAFGGKEPKPSEPAVDTTSGFQLDLGTISLERIRFDLDLQSSGTFMQVALGELEARIDTFSLDPVRVIIDAFDLRHTTVALRIPPGVKEAPAYPTLTNPLADIDVRFNLIALENIDFHMATIGTSDSLWLSLMRGHLAARSTNTTEQQLALKEVRLDGLRFGMITGASAVKSDIATAEPLWMDKHDAFRYWTQDWDLAIDQLHVGNSGFAMHSDRISAPTRLVDPEHLVLTDLGLDARDLVVNNDRMAVQLDSLSMRGGADSVLINMGLGIEATPAAMVLSNGSLSVMENTFHYDIAARPGDLEHFLRTPEAVPMEANVSGDLEVEQLRHFLAELGVALPQGSPAPERWHVKAGFKGTMRDIDHASLALSGDGGTRVNMNGSVRAVDRWPHSSFDLKVNELTLGKGSRALLVAQLPPNTPIPQRLTLSGTAKGQDGALRATIDLESDLGDLSGSAAVSDRSGALPDRIALDLKADNLAAATLTGDTALGPMSFTLVVDAKGLKGAEREGTLTFTPTRLSYQHHDLSSLRLTADVLADSVHAELKSDADAAALDLLVRGPWPEPGDSLAMDLDLTLRRLDLDELGLTEHMLHADGRITGQLALLSATRGRASLQAPGLHLFNEQRSFRAEHFTLNALLDTDSTAVELDCDVARVAYHANLSLDSTEQLLRERLFGAFEEPYNFKPPPGRRIALNVDLPGTERLASLLLPDLRAMELKRLEAHYDSDRDALLVDVDLPRLDYGGVGAQGVLLHIDATGPKLEGQLNVVRVARDSLHLDDLVLEASNAPGALRTSLRMREGEVDRYRIGVDVRRQGDVPVLHVQEDLVLDRKTWQAAKGNALFLDPRGIRAEDFILSNGAQRVELRTIGDGTHLDIAGFELATITGLVRTEDTLAIIRGTLDGTVLLPLNAQQHLDADLRISDLHLMDVELGSVSVQATEEAPDRYRSTLALDAERNKLTALLVADLSHSDPNITLEGELDLNDLSLFSPFAKSYLFELGGAINGPLHYSQVGGDVKMRGQVAVTDGRIGLIKTGAVYRIPQDTVVFDEQGLSFSEFVLLDTGNNRFQLDGHVITSTSTPELDLRLRTDRFQLVNSTVKDNPTFYGRLISSMDLHIGGTALTPAIKGSLGVLDSTDLSIVLPGSRVELVDHSGIVQFTADLDAEDSLSIRTDGEMLRDSLAAQLPGVDLDLRVALDRDARFNVVIDPTTGDQATFRGEADLLFRYNPEGDMYLQGPFTVVDGGYTLEFYGLVKKRFELVPGGKIIWDGDPLAGRMDVQAKYSTTAAPYPLVANARGGLTESERNSLQARLPFAVLINIREAVQEPTVSFGLDMERQMRNSYPQVNSVLDQLAKPSNEEELNRQVFGLLVLSTFIENENGTDQGGSSLASTAARNSVNSILTQQLNQLTGNGIKGMDIQLGVNTYDQTDGGESYARTTVDYKVTQHILNDRVSIEAGGSMGADEKNQSVSSVSNTRAPQYAIAYDITEDGRLRLRAYHENAYDLYDGELVNNGVALMLTRDFEQNARERERLRQEIIKRRKAEQNTEEKK